MKFSNLGAAVLLGLFLSGCSQDEVPAKRPNVVLMVVDTLRADHLSLYGYERLTSPEIDKRADEGVVFEHAVSGSSWTIPSMAMMFTGKYSTVNLRNLAADDVTFVQSFTTAGYRTGGIVSNPLLGPVKQKSGAGKPMKSFNSGFEVGFDLFDVYKKEPGSARFAHHQANGWYADEVTRRGQEWVESTDASEAPYLLYLHYFDPHFPRMPKVSGQFDVDLGADKVAALRERTPGPLSEADAKKGLAFIEGEIELYDSEVAAVDKAVGEVFDWLEARGELGETVVILTADHGEGLWARPLLAGEKPKPYNKFPRLYSDHGVQLQNEQTWVPLVVWAPGLEQGTRVRDTVSLTDVAPTLHYLADLAPPNAGRDYSGINLFDDLGERNAVFSFCSRGSDITVDGRWRLHLPADYRIEKYGVGPELFDLQTDPGELVALDDPERIADLKARILAKRASLQQAAVLEAEEEKARRELLDDMGYVDQ